MNYNGYPASSFSSLSQDLDANGFSINNLETFTELEISTPSAPITANSAKYFTNASGILCSIDSHGVVRQYTITAGGVQDRIVAADASCSIICDPGGFIRYSGISDFMDNSVQNVLEIIASMTAPFTITKDNVIMTFDTDMIQFTINGNECIFSNTSGTFLISPDVNSVVAVGNNLIVIEVNTAVVTTITDSAYTITYGPNSTVFSQAEILSSMPIHEVSFHTPTLPEYSFDDSNTTGMYSSATGHVSIASNGAQVADFNSAGNNFKTVSVNSAYSLPTIAPTNGQVLTSVGTTPTWVNTFNGFQAQYSGAGIVVGLNANTQSICDTLVLGTNYSTGTFTYTVPITGIYELTYMLNWSWTSVINAATGRGDAAFRIVDGATTFPGYTTQQTFAALLTNQTFTMANTCTIYRTLNAGATVQVSLSNISSANSVTIIGGQFGTRLLQRT